MPPSVTTNHRHNHIGFDHSDGSRDQWPTNTKCVVDAHDSVNYMEIPIPSVDQKWRQKIGTWLAARLHYDNGVTGTWELTAFPKGYKLFTHLNGPKHNPRTDTYLFGAYTKFRTPNEFLEHALWLCKDMPLLANGRPDCHCRYCGPKRDAPLVPQRAGRGPVRNAPIRRGPGVGRGTPRTRQPQNNAPLLPFEPKWEGGGASRPNIKRGRGIRDTSQD